MFPKCKIKSDAVTVYETLTRAAGVKIFCAFAQKQRESDGSLEECFCKYHGIVILKWLFLGMLLILLHSSILSWHVSEGLYLSVGLPRWH